MWEHLNDLRKYLNHHNFESCQSLKLLLESAHLVSILTYGIGRELEEKRGRRWKKKKRAQQHNYTSVQTLSNEILTLYYKDTSYKKITNIILIHLDMFYNMSKGIECDYDTIKYR